MQDVKQNAHAAIIGDVVRSRDTHDRDALHDLLRRVLSDANATLSPVAPLRITVGDEYQGLFATVGEALHAALWLRLALLPRADVRHGIGWGRTAVLQEEPRVEDGPGWWAARDAIVAVEADSHRPGLRSARARYHRADDESGPDPHAVNAALLCRDRLVAAGDDRTVRLLRGLLDGSTQTELAVREGISPSAVSQRARNDGIAVVLAAEAMLREVA